LSMAATKKESKRDKKKKQTVSLAEFQTGKKAYQAPKRAPAKEEIVLPSGPRAREDDDDGNSRGGLGGAFAGGRDYKDRGRLMSHSLTCCRCYSISLVSSVLRCSGRLPRSR